MEKSKTKHVPSLSRGLRAVVLVALSPSAYRDLQKTVERLAKYREVESIDILTGDWDLALEVNTASPEALYAFLKRTFSNEGEVAKTKSLISLKRIEQVSSHLRE